MGKSPVKVPCPVCNSGLKRIAYWDNNAKPVPKYVRHDYLFICIKCEKLQQFEYAHNPKINRGRKPKNDLSI